MHGLCDENRPLKVMYLTFGGRFIGWLGGISFRYKSGCGLYYFFSPSSFSESSRISTLRIFPVTVIGKESTNFQYLGIL